MKKTSLNTRKFGHFPNFLLFTVPGTILIGILMFVQDWSEGIALSALILWIIFISVPGTYFGIEFFVILFKQMFETAVDYAAFFVAFIVSAIVFFAVGEYGLMPFISDNDESLLDEPLAAIFIILVPAFTVAVFVGRWFNIQRSESRR